MSFNPNNPILGSGAAAGANYIMGKNKGCRVFYDAFAVLFGLAFMILGVIILGNGSFLGFLFFFVVGLGSLYAGWKDIQRARRNLPR